MTRPRPGRGRRSMRLRPCGRPGSVACPMPSHWDAEPGTRIGRQLPQSNRRNSNTGGGNRTHTGVPPQRILSPQRLPFRHAGAVRVDHSRGSQSARILRLATERQCVAFIRSHDATKRAETPHRYHAKADLTICSNPPSCLHATPIIPDAGTACAVRRPGSTVWLGFSRTVHLGSLRGCPGGAPLRSRADKDVDRLIPPGMDHVPVALPKRIPSATRGQGWKGAVVPANSARGWRGPEHLLGWLLHAQRP